MKPLLLAMTTRGMQSTLPNLHQQAVASGRSLLYPPKQMQYLSKRVYVSFEKRARIAVLLALRLRLPT